MDDRLAASFLNYGECKMIIKNEKYELEISETTGFYFGSKSSGQLFRNWEECKEEEKHEIEMILQKVDTLLKTLEKIFLSVPDR
jgi:hypothetical protein